MPAQKRGFEAMEDDYPAENHLENGYEEPQDEEGTSYFTQIPPPSTNFLIHRTKPHTQALSLYLSLFVSLIICVAFFAAVFVPFVLSESDRSRSPELSEEEKDEKDEKDE